MHGHGNCARISRQRSTCARNGIGQENYSFRRTTRLRIDSKQKIDKYTASRRIRQLDQLMDRLAIT